MSFRSNLRIQLLMALLVVPLVVAVIAWRQAQARREAAAREVLAEVQEVADRISHQEAPVVEAARQMLTLLALLPEVRSGDFRTCSQFLASIRPSFPQWGNLGVVGSDGRVTCSALPSDPTLDLGDRPWFKDAMATGGFAIGTYQVGRITRRHGLNFGLPMADAKGRVHGVVFGALDLGWLEEMLGDSGLPDGGQVALLDEAGRILVASPPMPEFVGQLATDTPAFAGMDVHEAPVGRMTGPDGVERLVARVVVAPQAGTGHLAVAAAVPAETALAETRAAFGRDLGFLAGMLLLAALVVSAADLWLLRRLDRIVSAARRLATGDLAARTGLRNIADPIGELARAFDDMAEHVMGETRRLAFEATHDSLTGLPNRAAVRRAIEEVLARGPGVALLLVIVDRMHEVVNTLGHPTGDTLLREVGPRLRAVVGEGPTIGRVGGGEFVVVLPRDDPDGKAVLALANKVRLALEEPFQVDGITVEPGGAVGIALAPEHGTDPDRLLQLAGVAAVISRRGGLEPVLYSPGQDPFSPRRLRLLGALRRGMERGEMTLRFQPKVDLRTGRAAGAEALVRWRHPELGDVSPTEFVGLAEQTGVIRPLTAWVLGEAMVHAVSLRRAGLLVPISVNISARDLTDPHFPTFVLGLLREAGARAEDMELEVTESALMVDPVLARRTLLQLREGGFGVAVDDFGTGYSSLAYLRDLPLHTIKIDQRFVRGAGEGVHDPAITRSVVELGHNLGMTVVAEGVHSARATDELRALGCDMGQGEWFGRALELAAFEAWLRTSDWAVVEEVPT